MGQCECYRKPSTNYQFPKNFNEEKPYINIHVKNSTKINDLNNLYWRYNDIKTKNKFFYDDIEKQESYIKNYKTFIAELNYQINNLKDKLNISVIAEKYFANLLNEKENNELYNNIDNISNKINQFYNLIEKQKIELKYLENNFQIIQEQFNEIEKNKNKNKNKQKNQDYLFSTNIQYIKEQLNQSEKIIKNLNQNKMLYDKKKSEIENEINAIQNKTENKINTIKVKQKKSLKKYNLNKYYNDSIN